MTSGWSVGCVGGWGEQESVFVQVSAGTYYTCGILLDTQHVRCWGRRMDPPSGQRFLQISVGEWHACGITEDGRPVCWGASALTRQTDSG